MWQLNKVEMVPPVIFYIELIILDEKKNIKIKTVATNWNKNYKASSPAWINRQFELIGSSVFCVVASRSWNNNLEQTEGSHYVAHIHGVHDDWGLPLDCCGDGQSKGPLLNLWLLVTWANDLNPFLTPLKVPLLKNPAAQTHKREQRGKKIYLVCGEKKSITKTREKQGRRKKMWALGVCERSLVFQWTGSGEFCHFIVLLHWSNLERAVLLKAVSEWHMGSWCEARLPCVSSRPKVFLRKSTEQLFCFFKRQQQPPSPSLLPSFPPSTSLPPSHSLSFFPSSSDSH